MTLEELKERIKLSNLQGMSDLTLYKLEHYQRMAFEWILNLCEPLNLLIPYLDDKIHRNVGNGWFLRKPIIATKKNEYIDIDERLELAFVYIIVSFLAMKNGHEKRDEAYRLVLEYAINVQELGYEKAKEFYEQNSFITNVRFDCYGKFYEVSEDFIKLLIDCHLCNKACMRADESKQLKLYRKYLEGDVSPLDRELLEAFDAGVFVYLLENMHDYKEYSSDKLSSVTTHFKRFEDSCNGEDTAENLMDVRLSQGFCCA